MDAISKIDQDAAQAGKVVAALYYTVLLHHQHILPLLCVAWVDIYNIIHHLHASFFIQLIHAMCYTREMVAAVVKHDPWVVLVVLVVMEVVILA